MRRVSVFVLACLGYLFPTLVFSQDVAVPEDFELVFISRPLHASRNIEIESVTIRSDGSVLLSPVGRYSGTMPDLTYQLLPEDTLEFDAETVASIYAAVVENDFFTLDEFYNDPMIMGGDVAQLSVTANGQTREVATRNIRVTAFDNITLLINSFLPEDRRLLYNAINGAEYEEVER